MKVKNTWKITVAAIVGLLITPAANSANVGILTEVQTLHVFDAFPGGGGPAGKVVQLADGSIYGVTGYGGDNTITGIAGGVVYKLAADGTYTVLVTFLGPNGYSPNAGLTLAGDGNMYGTTNDVHSTVFRITPSGTFSRIGGFGGESFCDLEVGPGGDFYTTSANGGANGRGAVLRITTSGSVTTLYSFTSGADGGIPFGGVVFDGAGNLYGTTRFGGSADQGVVYRLAPNGTQTVLHSFNGTDGGDPQSTMVIAPDGNLYGVTFRGGLFSSGVAFRLSLTGEYAKLFDFNDIAGAHPRGLMLSSDGNMYGTTEAGGLGSGLDAQYIGDNNVSPGYGNGTIFRMDQRGLVTPIVFFDGANGIRPDKLTQISDGTILGTTFFGGTRPSGIGYGTLFRISKQDPAQVVASVPGVLLGQVNAAQAIALATANTAQATATATANSVQSMVFATLNGVIATIYAAINDLFD